MQRRGAWSAMRRGVWSVWLAVGVVGILWPELFSGACFGQPGLNGQRAGSSETSGSAEDNGFSGDTGGCCANRAAGQKRPAATGQKPDAVGLHPIWPISFDQISEHLLSPKPAPDAVSQAGLDVLPLLLGQRNPKRDVWLIDTHEAVWQTDLSEAVSTIRYWRLGDSAAWEAVDQESFFSEMARPVPTVIYIHGNWTDVGTAIQQAWTIGRPLWEAAGGNRRFRLVVWCWPAERTASRLLSDLRFKAGRSDVEAYLLARHLEPMPPSKPILLVGYSFGARVITGALHLVGGGRLMGRSLRPDASITSGTYSSESRSTGLRWPAGTNAATAPEQSLGGCSRAGNGSHLPGPFRAVLLAAAIGNDWLLPGGRHQQALLPLEKMLVTVNWADPALRWYHRLEPCDSPALGWAGLPAANCPAYPLAKNDLTGKIEWLSVTSSVGKQHTWRVYLESPDVQARLLEYVFGLDSSDGQP